jgi:thiamine pyrophosphokinase
MKTLLVANGDLWEEEARLFYNTAAYCICCDGGLRHMAALGREPDLLVGDFDSADPGLLAWHEGRGVPLARYPAEKDYTDLELGLRLALKKGASEIYVVGGVGGRLDHTLANVQCLTLALATGVPATLYHGRQATSLAARLAHFTGKPGFLISLLPLAGPATGVETQGLRYPLKGETLTPGQTRGVSNVFAAEEATVRVAGGLLWVVREWTA